MNYNQTTNVLIIDDDAVNNFIAETLIKKAAKDAEITICLNGQEAIEQLLSIKQSSGKLPRFIFLDIAMPVMDGWKFLDEYHRLKLGDGSNIDRALGNAIVKEYVKKPLSMELVKRILRVDHHDNW
jgi:CheY-like chemotaxis protein